jgi:hypothetical protein
VGASPSSTRDAGNAPNGPRPRSRRSDARPIGAPAAERAGIDAAGNDGHAVAVTLERSRRRGGQVGPTYRRNEVIPPIVPNVHRKPLRFHLKSSTDRRRQSTSVYGRFGPVHDKPNNYDFDGIIISLQEAPDDS